MDKFIAREAFKDAKSNFENETMRASVACGELASAEVFHPRQTETIDQNRLINVCVLHIFISASNINGDNRICFSNEREAIKYFRHTSLKIQSREGTCIF